MWDVVVWSDQAAIDFVPSSWANEDNTLYKYPTNLSETKIRELIYESKDISQNFIWCGAKLKKKHVRTLDRAKELCHKGQFTSTIESSDASEEEPLINKRKKTRRLIEEYDANTSQKRGVPCSDQESSNDEMAVTRKKFSFPKSVGHISSSGIGSCAVENTNIVRNSPVFLSQHKLNSITTEHIYRSASTPTSPAIQRTTSTDDVGASLHKILKNQAEFNFEIREIKKKLDNIENRLLVSTTQKENEDPEVYFIDKLPMTTVHEVDEMETIISDHHAFNNLTNMLFLVGGDSPQKTIYSIMKKIFTNELAQLYSGQGKKHKLPFCSLKIYQAVKKAVRKRHASSTDDELKKMVALYLAQSKARISHKKSAQDDDGSNNE